MPRFTLFHGGRIQRSLSLDNDEIRIGRLPGLEIELPTPTVSREHAHVRREGKEYVLEDAGSVNGVFVRGRRVTQHVLAAGDSVRIEDYTLVFEPPDDIFQAGLVEMEASGDGDSQPGDLSMTYLNISKFLSEE